MMMWALLLLVLSCCGVAGFTIVRHDQYSHWTVVSNTVKPSLATSTCLGAKLWDRLQIEEDPEPFWYLLNCIAGFEMDLLRQVRERCKDMPDAIKFVVPTEKKTRSHGANRMVTENKVKYQGYVFTKLRLCPEVYEAIQSLDLCRSWMGTVNHKGYKKLPPAPVALNELEVENFGLEEYEEEHDDEVDEDDVIVDTEEAEAAEKDSVDQKALKVYLGLKVEDMVKVTKKGSKFQSEDGIVRRLKDGQILVRFFTYGTMFEEWMESADVRKLSNEEVLRGLSGPSRPITQRDFDDPHDRDSKNRPSERSSMRRDLMSNVKGTRGPRNRRQDRVERGDNVKRDIFGRTEQERDREERNWKWYQERQRNKDGRGVTTGQVDDEWNFRSGRKDDWAESDVDSQWGRGSQRQQRRERTRSGPTSHTSQETRRMQNAMEGKDDWSAFVSPAPSPAPNPEEDAFFASLMSDLSDDLGSSTNSPVDPSSASKGTGQHNDDDFFASLMSELSTEGEAIQNQSKKRAAQREAMDDESDFFASLEAELGAALENKKDLADHDTDDFFAKLEAEMSSDTSVQSSENERSPTAADRATDASRRTSTRQSSKTAEGTSATASGEEFGKYTVPVLKEMLKERGLKVSGKKSELIERLQQH